MSFWNGKPKITITITNKRHDCFFGQVKQSRATDYYCIAGAYINIINNSPVSITLSTLSLVIGKERLDLINKNNEYWEEVVFYFKNRDGMTTSDGTAIPYQDCGLAFPRKLDSYDAITGCVLFHNFPARIRKRCRGTIIVSSAIGRIKKKVVLYEYNEQYAKYELENIQQYERSRVT